MGSERAVDVYDLVVELRSRRFRFFELIVASFMASQVGGRNADSHPHVLTLWKGDDMVLRWAFTDRDDCRHNSARILYDLERLSPERFADAWLSDPTELYR